MAILSKDSFKIVTQESNAKKGPLVKVQIRPGQYVKMYEADAIEKGFIKPKPKPQVKSKPPQEDKMQRPEENKEAEPVSADFASIPGVGPATARAIVAHGILTFDQLREAGELPYLTGNVNKAIEEWRDSG